MAKMIFRGAFPNPGFVDEQRVEGGRFVHRRLKTRSDPGKLAVERREPALAGISGEVAYRAFHKANLPKVDYLWSNLDDCARACFESAARAVIAHVEGEPKGEKENALGQIAWDAFHQTDAPDVDYPWSQLSSHRKMCFEAAAKAVAESVHVDGETPVQAATVGRGIDG
jgi:hypothetical protein